MKDFLDNHKILATFILFLIFFIIIMLIKPGFVFTKDGIIKDFGLGYTNKTVLPLWVLVIIFAILSYFIVSII